MKITVTTDKSVNRGNFADHDDPAVRLQFGTTVLSLQRVEAEWLTSALLLALNGPPEMGERK